MRHLSNTTIVYINQKLTRFHIDMLTFMVYEWLVYIVARIQFNVLTSVKMPENSTGPVEKFLGKANVEIYVPSIVSMALRLKTDCLFVDQKQCLNAIARGKRFNDRKVGALLWLGCRIAVEQFVFNLVCDIQHISLGAINIVS